MTLGELIAILSQFDPSIFLGDDCDDMPIGFLIEGLEQADREKSNDGS